MSSTNKALVRYAGSSAVQKFDSPTGLVVGRSMMKVGGGALAVWGVASLIPVVGVFFLALFLIAGGFLVALKSADQD